MTRTTTRRAWAAALAFGLITVGTLARAQATMVAGEVTKIDKAGARVTLKHGEIRDLDMPLMTMTFRARYAKLLDGLNVGDRVRFAAERIEGQYTLTALSKAL